MAEPSRRLIERLAWLESLASRRAGAAALFLLGLLAYAIRAIAWPLQAGRDLDEYIYAWVQLFDHDVLLPWSMLFRTPATPVFVGGALDAFDGRFAEPRSEERRVGKEGMSGWWMRCEK